MEERAKSLEVLILCASPIGDLATLKLPQELIEIEKRLRNSQVPVRLKRVFPPTIKQLRRELAAMSQRGDQPGVFHFLGHGDDDGLYFEDEFGQSQLVKGSELKSALNESPVKLLVLNACWSATKRGISLVEFLQREKVAETAIGHSISVADDSAIKFAQEFYELVMSGKSMKTACQQAANSLAEAGLPGAADIKLVGNGELTLTASLYEAKRFVFSAHTVAARNSDRLRQKIDAGKPVVLSVKTFPSWDYPTTSDTGEISMPFPGEKSDGGHAICVVGYELNSRFPGGGAFIIRNSWGTTWAKPNGRFQPGYGTLYFEYVKKYALEACS